MNNRSREKSARSRSGARWGMAALLALVWVALVLAAMDGWQRPGLLARWHAGWFLLVAGLALATWTRWLVRGMNPRRRWCRVAIIAAGFIGGAIGLRHGNEIVAARTLVGQFVEPHREPRLNWVGNVLDWTAGRLDDFGLPNRWLARRHGIGSGATRLALIGPLSTFHHRLEASRPSLRLRFAREAMETAKPDPHGGPGRLAVGLWHGLFPAVTGPDVTLRQRQRLWDIARRLHADERAAAESRMAAALWMGLIVLTDPEAFADRRPAARDAMLGWPGPPLADTGDVWMRTLDLLLLSDPVEKQHRLTAAAAANPAWLRRAIRERVRAVRGHLHPAIAKLAAATGDDGPEEAGIALWGDLAAYLRSVGDTEGAPLETGLRDVLIEWLCGEWTGILDANWQPYLEYRQWGFLFRQADGFPITALRDPAGSERLRKRAADLLERLGETRERHLAGSPRRATWFDDVDRLLILRRFLGDAESKRLAIRLGDMLVDLAWSETETSRDPGRLVRVVHEEALHRLGGLWTEIDRDSRIRFGRMIAATLAGSTPRRWIHGYLDGYSIRFEPAIALDAASEDPQTGIASRLLLGLLEPDAGRLRPPADGGPAHPLADSSGRFLVPDFTGNEIEAAIPDVLAFIDATPAHSLTLTMLNRVIMPLRIRFRDRPDSAERERILRALLAAGGISTGERDMAELFDLSTRSRETAESMLQIIRSIPRSPPAITNFVDWVLSSPERLATVLDGSPYESLQIALIDRLERGQVDPQVLRVAVESLQRASRGTDPVAAFSAHACLLRLAPHLDHDAASAIRRQVLHDIRRHWPALDDWPNRHSLGAGSEVGSYQLPITPRALWSEGVPWADDPLAAQFAWSGEIKHQTMLAEAWGGHLPTAGAKIFAVLAGAMDLNVNPGDSESISFPPADRAVNPNRWRYRPPALPFEPTPWQRARELHQRRPDLRFPDRAMLRPTQRDDS